ncbi:MAG: hypothetical protein OJF55_002629 [Rhodanobacteraceae bacterium]|jgi:hypothetical protein|nr:MAG: hypothetical protein OJF55_002629 [Rhodanobacteraceae bacterium]
MTNPDQSAHPPEAWSRALGTGFCGWRVLDDTTLALDLPAHCACNMTGAIRVAQAILPGVKTVQTFAGGVPDTRYEKPSARAQTWHAIPPHVARPATGSRPSYPPTPRNARTRRRTQP